MERIEQYGLQWIVQGETLYEAFYNMWTQHKIMIVPAPTEIGEQVENALMLYRDTLTNLQKCYREVFNAYFIKLGNAGLYRIGREDTVTDIADTFAASNQLFGLIV